MEYYYPGKRFPAISVTGNYCEVMCPHCRGYYLESMIKAETPDRLVSVCKDLDENGAVGCLISGGCDRTGRVPLPLEAVRVVREETDLILNLHTGLVDKETAETLGCIDCYISFDVPTPFALTHLFRLPVTQEEYFESLNLLEGLKVVPHVMVGLENEGEVRTIEAIKEMGFSSLVLIVFTPTRKTPLGRRHVGDVTEIFQKARALFPRLILGCMRPREKSLEEDVAVFDGIVLPTRWARERVETLGLPVEVKETCCVVE